LSSCAANALALPHIDLSEIIVITFAWRTVIPSRTCAVGHDRADHSGEVQWPITESFSFLRAHVCQWGDHALSAGQRVPAEGAADLAGDPCAATEIADVGCMH